MVSPFKHPNESKRLQELESLRVLNELPECELDDLVQFCARVLEVPVAWICLVDEDRLWVKAKFGIDKIDSTRDRSFCGYTILQSGLFEVIDATTDERFFDHPLVNEEASIVSYAGLPLLSEGLPIGTLCVLDTKPRTLTEQQRDTLALMATQVERFFNLRKSMLQQQVIAEKVLNERNLLSIISEIQQDYILGYDTSVVFERILDTLLEFTGSEFGFIGEALEKSDGKPYVKAHFYTDISWDEESRQLYKKNTHESLIFENLDNLFGEVIKTESPVVTNDAKNHPASVGVPKGHPEVNTFAGLPFQYQDKLIGMVGLGNGNYESADFVQRMTPLLNTCSQLIVAHNTFMENQAINESVERERLKYQNLAAKFSSLSESVHDGLVEINPQTWAITDCNVTFASMLGYLKEELIGKSLNEISKERVHQERMKQLLDDKLPKQKRQFEKTYIDKQGADVPAQVSIFETTSNKDNKPLIWGLVKDLREQKAQEQKRIQDRKMDSLGGLSGGIAHDLNNILGIILGNIELMELSPRDEVTSRNLGRIKVASERAADLVNKLLEFSRQRDIEVAPIDLREAVQNSLNFIDSIKPSTISIETQFEQVQSVMASESTVTQILMNLISNAVQAIEPNQGNISIVLENVPRTAKVRLSVKDDGCGMDDTALQRIYDPFYTTKRDSKGTGLGLSIVYSICNELGAEIRAYSRVGHGTEFSILFPVINEVSYGNQSQLNEAITEDESARNILVCDDEPELAGMLESFMGAQDHHVTSFVDSKLALRAFRENPDDFDIIITDDEMPQIRGTEFARQVKESKGEAHIILITGHVSDDARKIEQEGFIDKIFQKPVKLADVSEYIRGLALESG